MSDETDRMHKCNQLKDDNVLKKRSLDLTQSEVKANIRFE